MSANKKKAGEEEALKQSGATDQDNNPQSQNPEGADSQAGGTLPEDLDPEDYQVVVPFKDNPQYLGRGQVAQSYAPGDTLPEDLDPERLRSLIQRGIVKRY